MRDKEELFQLLTELDGKEFSLYQRLVGDFDFSRFVLKLGLVQEASESEPTLFVVRVPQYIAAFPQALFSTPVRRVGLEDYLTRQVAEQIEGLATYDEEGLSRRRLAVVTPGQQILPRSSVVVAEEYVEARIAVNLPAREGRVLGDAAKSIFFDDLPEVVNDALIYCNLDEEEVEQFVHLMEDADQVRQVLPTRGWVSFVGAQALPARLEGTDLPDFEEAEPLLFEEGLLQDVETLNMGPVRGIGIPAGITLILGDDHSGRREFMHAVAAGIYNHVPGDGRELVLTIPDAVYISSESDRSVQRVNVSPFVTRAGADGGNPARFSAEVAAPDVAQAASTMEALEVGARALLFDESDSCPTFLSHDSRLRNLFDPDHRPGYALASRAKQLSDELGVSLVVAGWTSVAEFIPVADTILLVEGHRVRDVTEEARQLAVSPPAAPADASVFVETLDHARWVVPSSIDPSAGRHDSVIHAPDTSILVFGREWVDLTHVRQLADPHQTTTIGIILSYAKSRYLDQPRPLREVLDLIDRDLSSEGLECLTRDLRGDVARPRRYEIAAALNRLNALRIAEPSEDAV